MPSFGRHLHRTQQGTSPQNQTGPDAGRDASSALSVGQPVDAWSLSSTGSMVEIESPSAHQHRPPQTAHSQTQQLPKTPPPTLLAAQQQPPPQQLASTSHPPLSTIERSAPQHSILTNESRDPSSTVSSADSGLPPRRSGSAVANYQVNGPATRGVLSNDQLYATQPPPPQHGNPPSFGRSQSQRYSGTSESSPFDRYSLQQYLPAASSSIDNLPRTAQDYLHTHPEESVVPAAGPEKKSTRQKFKSIFSSSSSKGGQQDQQGQRFKDNTGSYSQIPQGATTASAQPQRPLVSYQPPPPPPPSYPQQQQQQQQRLEPQFQGEQTQQSKPQYYSYHRGTSSASNSRDIVDSKSPIEPQHPTTLVRRASKRDRASRSNPSVEVVQPAAPPQSSSHHHHNPASAWQQRSVGANSTTTTPNPGTQGTSLQGIGEIDDYPFSGHDSDRELPLQSVATNLEAAFSEQQRQPATAAAAAAASGLDASKQLHFSTAEPQSRHTPQLPPLESLRLQQRSASPHFTQPLHVEQQALPVSHPVGYPSRGNSQREPTTSDLRESKQTGSYSSRDSDRVVHVESGSDAGVTAQAAGGVGQATAPQASQDSAITASERGTASQPSTNIPAASTEGARSEVTQAVDGNAMHRTYANARGTPSSQGNGASSTGTSMNVATPTGAQSTWNNSSATVGGEPSLLPGSESGKASPSLTPSADDEGRQYRELISKYKNVKRLYFDGKTVIEQLTSQVEMLQNAVANQRMSQSRTAWDDNEYIARFNRLNGAINNLAFNIRKDWVSVPTWLQRSISADAIRTGKQEMTALGRAFVSRWLLDEVFNKCFHPGLEPALSAQLKDIELSIRGNAYTMHSPEEHDDLTTKIVNWRMATFDGLSKKLGSSSAPDNRSSLIAKLTSNLTASVYHHLQDPPPAGVEGSTSMIVELAVAIAANLPMESRDVSLSYPLPGEKVQPKLMEVEKANLPALEASTATSDSEDSDDSEDDDEAKQGGNSGRKGKDASVVRFAGFVALEVRGRQVLLKAPTWTM